MPRAVSRWERSPSDESMTATTSKPRRATSEQIFVNHGERLDAAAIWATRSGRRAADSVRGMRGDLFGDGGADGLDLAAGEIRRHRQRQHGAACRFGRGEVALHEAESLDVKRLQVDRPEVRAGHDAARRQT